MVPAINFTPFILAHYIVKTLSSYHLILFPLNCILGCSIYDLPILVTTLFFVITENVIVCLSKSVTSLNLIIKNTRFSLVASYNYNFSIVLNQYTIYVSFVSFSTYILPQLALLLPSWLYNVPFQLL